MEQVITVSALGNDPNRMHYSWDVSQQRQQDVQPKGSTNSYLKKNSQRGENNCYQNTY
jgi:hypothetical protein